MIRRLVTLSLLFPCLALAQQRYLVTPGHQPRLIEKSGTTAAGTITHRIASERLASESCTNRSVYGYPPDIFPPHSNRGVYHKDVVGQWFVAKTTGTIDTVFWLMGNSVGALDSIVKFRIRKSNIGPDYGPGVRDYAHGVNFPPPCQNWGYWIDTNDEDQGITPFPEEATDTTWHSTIAGPVPTRPPITEDLFSPAPQDLSVHSGQVNSFDLLSLGAPIHVTAGDKFFITMKINAAGHVANDTRTEWPVAGFRVTADDENYPSRNWVFREHGDSTVSCGQRGWTALGGLGPDSLDVAMYNWWYVMTATANTPPEIRDLPQGSGLPHNTASTSSQTVTVSITDCDATVPGYAGSVAGAWLEISTSPTSAAGSLFSRLPDVAMSPASGDNYSADIPGQPVGTTISWRVRAADDKGLINHGPAHTYKIVSLRNGYYYVDTAYTPVWQNIAVTGTQIDPGQFFINTGIPGHGTDPGDDGTAGPIDLGGDFNYFGKTMRYAWVGVNGALALSASPTDTQDVNANGYYTSEWDIPGLQRDGRADVSHPERMPHALIAPFWADFILADTIAQYSWMRHGPGMNPSCEYIIEWDSMAHFNDFENGAFCPGPTFRVILNKCDGSIEFQWNEIGCRNQDSIALVGLEAYADSVEMVSSNPPVVFICNQTYPSILRPMSEKTMKFLPIPMLTTQAGWNMLSVSTIPSDYHQAYCYPDAISDAFAFEGRYIRIPSDSDLVRGVGYWLKFNRAVNGTVWGRPLSSCTITVHEGWNMIGSSSAPIPTASIIAGANTVINSRFFGYNTGYVSATTIDPGRAYWVRIHLLNGTTGTLTLCGPASRPKPSQSDELSGLNSITLCDKNGQSQQLFFGSGDALKSPADFYEMPPAAPGFDARFGSGRMAESYPQARAGEDHFSFPIAVTSDVWPVTVSWHITTPVAGHTFVLRDGSRRLSIVEGTGRCVMQAPPAHLTLEMGPALVIPSKTGLAQNYPNPFNPSTNVRFEIRDARFVKIAVFDILGKEVATLVNEMKQPGSYSMAWDATDFPSGIYFCSMKAGSVTETRKMVLMK